MEEEKILYLLCHAQAKNDEENDFGRRLSPQGKQDLILLRRYLRMTFPRPEVVFCSKDDRCRQTAEEIKTFLKNAQIVYHHLLYLASGYTLLDLMGALDDKVQTALILSHEKALKQFIRLSLRTDEMWQQRKRAGYSSSFFVTLAVPKKEGWRAFDFKKATLKDVFYP